MVGLHVLLPPSALTPSTQALCQGAIKPANACPQQMPPPRSAAVVECDPPCQYNEANLVDNAIKYGGGAEVGLAAEANRTVVAVENRGPGSHVGSEHDKVFSPFYQVEGSPMCTC